MRGLTSRYYSAPPVSFVQKIMPMLKFAMCVVLLALSSGYANDAASETLKHLPSSKFSLVAVKGATLGQQEEVIKIIASIDGRRAGECEPEYLEDDVCLQGIELEPGTHQLHLNLWCRDKKGATLTCRYTANETFTTSAGQELTYDFKSSLATPDTPKRYLSQVDFIERGKDSCLNALYHYYSVPSCKAEGLAAAAEALDGVQNNCSTADLNTKGTSKLLRQASNHHFSLTIAQCLPATALNGRGQLPDMLARPGRYTERWPKSTLPNEESTWTWSRNADFTSPRTEHRGTELVEEFRQAFNTITPKVDTTFVLIDALRDEVKLKNLANTLTERPFSIDPRENDGHLTYFFMAFGVGTPKFSDHLAEGLGSKNSLHCGRPDFAEKFARFVVQDKLVSTTEWQNFKSFVNRTPKNIRLTNCDYVFRDPQFSGVSHEERLGWLAEFDCSNKRVSNLRGKHLEPHLRNNMRGRGYDDLIDRLRKKHSRCLDAEG